MKTLINLTFLLIMIFAFVSSPAQNTKYNDAQNMQVTVNQEASYPGGDMQLFQTIYSKIKWPEATKGKVIQGEVMLSFNVQPDSSLTDFAIMSGVGMGVDEEIVRVMKTLKYSPSIQNGTKVPMNLIVTVPIRHRGE